MPKTVHHLRAHNLAGQLLVKLITQEGNRHHVMDGLKIILSVGFEDLYSTRLKKSFKDKRN